MSGEAVDHRRAKPQTQRLKHGTRSRERATVASESGDLRVEPVPALLPRLGRDAMGVYEADDLQCPDARRQGDVGTGELSA